MSDKNSSNPNSQHPNPDKTPPSPYPDGASRDPAHKELNSEAGEQDPGTLPQQPTSSRLEVSKEGPVPPLQSSAEPFSKTEYSTGPKRHPPSPPVLPPNPDYQQFSRRIPSQQIRPDTDGYYPQDYYLGPDWPRILLKGLTSLILIVGLTGLGIYLFERYDPRGDAQEITTEATPTPLQLLPVFECAGDPEPVTEMTAPSSLLIAGRTADSQWLAFRNPVGLPLQLWVRSDGLSDFDPLSVGVVGCATSANQFPTPPSVTLTPAPPTNSEVEIGQTSD